MLSSWIPLIAVLLLGRGFVRALFLVWLPPDGKEDSGNAWESRYPIPMHVCRRQCARGRFLFIRCRWWRNSWCAHESQAIPLFVWDLRDFLLFFSFLTGETWETSASPEKERKKFRAQVFLEEKKLGCKYNWVMIRPMGGIASHPSKLALAKRQTAGSTVVLWTAHRPCWNHKFTLETIAIRAT